MFAQSRSRTCDGFLSFVAPSSPRHRRFAPTSLTNGLGKKVTVKTEDAELSQDGRPVDTSVGLGENFEVLKVEGDRIQTSRGWLRKSDVVPFDHAIGFFSDRIRKAPTAESYRARGQVYVRRDEFAKAIADLNEAVRLNPKDAESYAIRGAILAKGGKSDDALRDLDEAIRLAPTDVLPRRLRGTVWEQQENYDKALADFDEAIRLRPSDDTSYAARGALLANKGKLDDALRDLDEAIRLAPADALPRRLRVRSGDRRRTTTRL